MTHIIKQQLLKLKPYLTSDSATISLYFDGSVFFSFSPFVATSVVLNTAFHAYVRRRLNLLCDFQSFVLYRAQISHNSHLIFIVSAFVGYTDF